MRVSNYKMKLLLQRLLLKNSPVFLLGIDIGTIYVGFAKGNLKDNKTELLPTFKSSYPALISDPQFPIYMKKLLKSHKIDGIVVGYPTEYQSTQMKFQAILDKLILTHNIAQPITEVSESCTTLAANQIIEILSEKYQMKDILKTKEMTDSLAAVLILQIFMRYFHK